MPELPEVETVVRSLRAVLPGRRIVALTRSKLRPGAHATLPLTRIVGERIDAVERRAKLVCILAGGHALVVHLKMSGQLLVAAPGKPSEPLKTRRLHLLFADRSSLNFHDTRRFGFVLVRPRSDLSQLFDEMELGPEPLSSNFQWDDWRACASTKRTAIKRALLDQSFVAGIGNIYADETLFAAGVHPLRMVNALSDSELHQIFDAIPVVLRAGIEHRGTTLRFYRDGNGREGGMQQHLKVYGREGQLCVRCGSRIKRIVIGGRSSRHCPSCQK